MLPCFWFFFFSYFMCLCIGISALEAKSLVGSFNHLYSFS
jgi:hypothetical protein